MSAKGTFRLAVVLTVLSLGLCACGPAASSEERQAAAATSEAPTSSEPGAEESTATPEQVASIISGMEPDWREVIDEAGDCRFSWTLGRDDPIEQANGMACYMRETTIGYTARDAMDSLAELNVPESMSSLVNETNVALQGVADVDLEAACGEATEGPKNSKACDTALGERMWTYTSLESVLDKWGPYL